MIASTLSTLWKRRGVWLATALLAASQPGWAFGTKGDAALVAVTGGAGYGAATGVGAPAALAVAGVEAVGLFGCAFFDPPDTTGFAVRAAPPLLIASAAADPLDNAALNAAAQGLLNVASAAVRSVKGVQMSLDRLAGAQLVGTALDVSNQQQWLAEWRSQLRTDMEGTIAQINAFNSVLQSEAPALAGWVVTTDVIKQTRDAEAAGNFPTLEQDLINQWQLTALQVAQISSYVGQISDDEIDAAGPMTLATALAVTAQVCDVCLDISAPIPEPATSSLLLAGLVLLPCVARRVGAAGRHALNAGANAGGRRSRAA